MSRVTFSPQLIAATGVFPLVTMSVEMRDAFDWARLLTLVNGMGRAVSSALGKLASNDTRKQYIRMAAQAVNSTSRIPMPEDCSEFDKLRVAVGKGCRCFCFNIKDELCLLCTKTHGLFLFLRQLDGSIECALHVQPGNVTSSATLMCITTCTLALLHGIVAVMRNCFVYAPSEGGLVLDASSVPAAVQTLMNDFAREFAEQVMCELGSTSASPDATRKKRKAVVQESPSAAAGGWSLLIVYDLVSFVRALEYDADSINALAVHLNRFTPVGSYEPVTELPDAGSDPAIESALLRLVNVAQTVHFTRADLDVWRAFAAHGPL